MHLHSIGQIPPIPAISDSFALAFCPSSSGDLPPNHAEVLTGPKVAEPCQAPAATKPAARPSSHITAGQLGLEFAPYGTSDRTYQQCFQQAHPYPNEEGKGAFARWLKDRGIKAKDRVNFATLADWGPSIADYRTRLVESGVAQQAAEKILRLLRRAVWAGLRDWYSCKVTDDISFGDHLRQLMTTLGVTDRDLDKLGPRIRAWLRQVAVPTNRDCILLNLLGKSLGIGADIYPLARITPTEELPTRAQIAASVYAPEECGALLRHLRLSMARPPEISALAWQLTSAGAGHHRRAKTLTHRLASYERGTHLPRLHMEEMFAALGSLLKDKNQLLVAAYINHCGHAPFGAVNTRPMAATSQAAERSFGKILAYKISTDRRARRGTIQGGRWTETSATPAQNYSDFQRVLGFAMARKVVPDPLLRGLGYDASECDLHLVGFPQVFRGFIEQLAVRNPTKSLPVARKTFVCSVMQHFRQDTGWLWLHAEDYIDYESVRQVLPPGLSRQQMVEALRQEYADTVKWADEWIEDNKNNFRSTKVRPEEAMGGLLEAYDDPDEALIEQVRVSRIYFESCVRHHASLAECHRAALCWVIDAVCYLREFRSAEVCRAEYRWLDQREGAWTLTDDPLCLKGEGYGRAAQTLALTGEALAAMMAYLPFRARVLREQKRSSDRLFITPTGKDLYDSYVFRNSRILSARTHGPACSAGKGRQADRHLKFTGNAITDGARGKAMAACCNGHRVKTGEQYYNHAGAKDKEHLDAACYQRQKLERGLQGKKTSSRAPRAA